MCEQACVNQSPSCPYILGVEIKRGKNEEVLIIPWLAHNWQNLNVVQSNSYGLNVCIAK